jgi:hypothetical protein
MRLFRTVSTASASTAKQLVRNRRVVVPCSFPIPSSSWSQRTLVPKNSAKLEGAPGQRPPFNAKMREDQSLIQRCQCWKHRISGAVGQRFSAQKSDVADQESRDRKARATQVGGGCESAWCITVLSHTVFYLFKISDISQCVCYVCLCATAVV